MSADRIVKTVVLHASRQRVWRAITDSSEFGSWFGMKFDGPFAPGAKMRAVIQPTEADAEVAARMKAYAGIAFDIFIEKIEPQRLFSYRWHPGAVEPGYDYSAEPATLVEFVLEEQAGSILLTVTESGFDNIPLARRASAFSGNEGGWAIQMTLIAKYLARHP